MSAFIDEKVAEVVALAERVYVEKGYFFSGALSPMRWIADQINVDYFDAQQVVETAVARGVLQRRDCEGCGWELPVARRAELIEQHGLRRAWRRAAPAYHPSSRRHQGEVALVLDALAAAG